MRQRNIGAGSIVGATLDFTTGLPAGFTLVRNMTRYARAASAKWEAYAANAPRPHFDTYGAPLGMIFEKSHVDLSFLKTNPTVDPGAGGSWGTSPVGFWTKATPSLAGTGFEDVLTSLYQGVNATAGAATYALNGTVGTTAKVSIQALMNDFSGAGATGSKARLSSGSQIAPTAFGDFELLQIENETPTNGTRTAQVVLSANRTIYLGYLQMSRAPYCPTPLLHPVDNVAITVDNEYASAPISSLPIWSAAEVAFAFEWYHAWPFTTDNEPIFAFAKAASPTTDYCRIVGMADGTMKLDMVIGGVSAYSMTFAAPTRNTVCRAAARLKSGSFLAAVNGVGGVVSANAADWSGLDTVYINRLDTAYSNSMVRTIELYKQPQSDDQIIAASQPYAGGYL